MTKISLLKSPFIWILCVCLPVIVEIIWADIPGSIHFQGRILVGDLVYSGTGLLKFSLVSGDGVQTYWSSSPDGNGDGEPDKPVSLPISKGLYSLYLGETNLSNMAALAADIFTNSPIYLRTWFSDGTNGFERLSPDQRIGSSAYALLANSVPDGAITAAKLAANATNSAMLSISNILHLHLEATNGVLISKIDALSVQLEALSNRLNQVSAKLDTNVSVGFTRVSSDFNDTALVSQGMVRFLTLAAPPWNNGSTSNAPSARYRHAGAWTGSELIIWGGSIGSGGNASSGGMYNPTSDQWTTISPIDAPVARNGHSAVWTGQKFLVWGGYASGFVNSGGRYDNGTWEWTPMQLTSAPAGRDGHIAVWTGKYMVICGGRNSTGLLNDGALYRPDTDQWTSLNSSSAPSARMGAKAVWTGNRLIIWGGEDSAGPLNSGAQLIFDNDGEPVQWNAMILDNAPSARYGHSMVWTGSKVIVWGGRNSDAYLANGASYDPTANIWSSLSSSNAPAARSEHGAIWSGEQMVILGGRNGTGALSTSYGYTPLDDKWHALSVSGSPLARSAAVAVWTGSEVLVFGGLDSSEQPVAALQRLSPQATWYFYRKP